MDKLKIEYVPIDSIEPYPGNAKLHTPEQIEQIKKSMQEFGNIDPVGIWHNEIVEGHGRYQAAKSLGYETIPVIKLDSLTDEQRRVYGLIHNQLTINTGFDIEALQIELESISGIDMSDFGFDISVPDFENEDDDGYYGDEREKTYNSVNLNEYDESRTQGFYNMPIIKKCNYIPENLIGFNYVKTAKKTNVGVHFFIDDYQFERIWNSPQLIIERLKKFQCVFTPDWSLYMDMPMAMKIWNVYRSRLIGQMCQDAGIKVIPTLSWAEKETYQFCFDGIEQGGTVAVSTVGVMKSKSAKAIWTDGMCEAMKRLKPKNVICYGSKIDFDFSGVNVIYFKARQFGEGRSK